MPLGLTCTYVLFRLQVEEATQTASDELIVRLENNNLSVLMEGGMGGDSSDSFAITDTNKLYDNSIEDRTSLEKLVKSKGLVDRPGNS
jgi:hypothetical protein